MFKAGDSVIVVLYESLSCPGVVLTTITDTIILVEFYNQYDNLETGVFDSPDEIILNTTKEPKYNFNAWK
jgi:hypothetical protein